MQQAIDIRPRSVNVCKPLVDLWTIPHNYVIRSSIAEFTIFEQCAKECCRVYIFKGLLSRAEQTIPTSLFILQVSGQDGKQYLSQTWMQSSWKELLTRKKN